MSAWGKGGLAKSCNALLKRIEENDSTLKELIILPSKTFGTIEVQRLAKALQKNTHLVSIRASGHALDKESLEILSKALSTSNIQHIALGDKDMGDEGITAFCQPLKEHNGGPLIHVDFGWKNISEVCMAMIGQTFGNSPKLQYLNLSRNANIGDKGLIQFCQSATYSIPFPQLQYLDLSECQIGPDGLEELTNCLKNKNSMQLKLIDNPITNQGMTSIGHLISSSIVSNLSLEKCQIDDDGIDILTSFIKNKNNSSLTQLDLANNQFGPQSANLLSQSFQSTCWKLTELNLAGNPIGSEGTIDLCRGIHSITTLTNLNLCQTSCGIQGAMAAIKIPHLISLRLFHNQLQSEGFYQISSILAQSSLVNLDLGGNSAKEDAVVALLRSLIPTDKSQSSLKVLEIGGNEMGSQGEQIIQELSEKLPLLDIARDRPKT